MSRRARQRSLAMQLKRGDAYSRDEHDDDTDVDPEDDFEHAADHTHERDDRADSNRTGAQR